MDTGLFRLDGEIAVVTGAGAGIGKAIAKLFAAACARVVVSDLKAEAAEEVASAIRRAGGHAVGLACDVIEKADLVATVNAVSAPSASSHRHVGWGGVHPDSLAITEADHRLI